MANRATLLGGDDARTWALQLLAVLREPGGVEPGGFRARLIDAALAADPQNLALLGRAFPHLARAIEVWRRFGAGALLAAAGGEAP